MSAWVKVRERVGEGEWVKMSAWVKVGERVGEGERIEGQHERERECQLMSGYRVSDSSLG